MTNDEAKAKIKEHLLKQGKRSQTPDGHCLYYGPNGLRCAIGCLIPESEYNPKFEGWVTDTVIASCPSLKDLSNEMLKRMQRIHDSCAPSTWEQELKNL